jgi:inner membrane protein
MPTTMTHAWVAVGLGKCFTGRRMPFSFWALAAGLAALPDLDVIAFRLGIPYTSPLGHRGFTHSLLFALMLSLPVAALTYRRFGMRFGDLLGFFFVVTASHGLLDACTNGGEGIAFFWPFDDTRYFLPWRPIQVSHIGLSFFTTGHGWQTFQSELLWVWLPTCVIVAAVMAWRWVLSLNHREERQRE